ncbi:2Fe-2S iron-sulfur cluster-binding protein [uncultured Roseobacter sp.]|uniref:2Fe-2S iron-sulfur cluster-binding protein n=1 Tax=uncultured Roseobacter sp. TaxID=114847 RepID=UPI0026054987|nr:2Fe-2S iron-sulfur cluster-binding protein [uncultured Roseobacter sp.]
MADTATAGAGGAKFRLRIMIATGMVMFVFITMHLANLSLGLISVQAMEDWRWMLSGVWSSVPPLKILLQASLILHFLVALGSLYFRNTLKLPAYDMAQMVAGVLIIPLLGMHVFGVMAIDDLGLEPTYMIVLGQFWVVSPLDGLQQVVMLVVAWIHGAIGMYTWLQARDSSARVMNFFYPLVVALPILAMLGYVEAGRQIIPVDEGGEGFVLENDPNAAGPTVDPDMIPGIIAQAKERPRRATQISLGLVALVLVARWLRVSRQAGGRVSVTYTGRRPATFEADTGLTLLEMVRENDLPHASICRGRGRCGTCRVRVLSGADALPAPSEAEAKVLARWQAGPDERLACQLIPREGALEVERVIEADYSNLSEARTVRDGDAPAAAT